MTLFYHHHIPKTGGSYILHNLYKSGLGNIKINNKTISIYDKNFYDEKYFISKKGFNFMSGHFGAEPIEKIPEIKCFTTIRNPSDRIISHFSMSYFPIKSSKILQTFNSWLFDDSKDFNVKNNLQSMFLTSNITQEYKDCVGKETNIYQQKKYWNDGFGICYRDINMSEVKKFLKKITYVGKTESMDYFMENIYCLLNEEFNQRLIYKKEFGPKIDRYSSSLSSFIKKNITIKQKIKIEQMNELDYEVWETNDYFNK